MAAKNMFLVICLIVLFLNLVTGKKIIEDIFKRVNDMAPTGEPYGLHNVSSIIRCATLCNEDPNCQMFTIKDLGNGQMDCKHYQGESMIFDDTDYDSYVKGTVTFSHN